MATEDDSDVPETGAVFTFGKSRFADNAPSKFWIRNDKVIHVACGDEHTALVAESGRIFTFGANDWGQLGLGHNKPMNKPSCIKSLKHEKVKKVACGRSTTFVLTESGRVYSCGANGEGQLGLGDSDGQNVLTPQAVEELDGKHISNLSAGADHTAVLTVDGNVYIWGGGSEGQLGLGPDMTEVNAPIRLPIDEPVSCLSCGYYHTALVTASRRLYTFGETEFGKLGLGEEVEEHDTPQEIQDLEGRPVSVVCGGKHTVVITESGRVYTFGDGANGQLGHGNMLLQVAEPTEIANLDNVRIRHACCGENHTALISDKGQLYTFGDGRHGKLGLGEENFANQFRPSLCQRFAKFTVEQVSCGGCHMLTRAVPRLQNGDVDSDPSGEDEIDATTHILASVRNSHDFDLSGSISARNRRRDKLGDPNGTLTRTLPPLNSSMSLKALPPLNSTLPTGGDRTPNPLNRQSLQPIQSTAAPRVTAAPRQSKPLAKPKVSSEEDSAVSVSEDEEEDTENKYIVKNQSEKQLNSAPQPRPRQLPRMQDRNIKKASEEDSDEDENSEEETEEEEKPKRKSHLKQKSVAVSSSKRSKISDSEEEEEVSEKEDRKPKKRISKSTKKRVSEEETEESEDDRRTKSKKKGKKTKSDEEEEISEDHEEEDKKKKKKKVKEKDVKKKKKGGGIFGRKKVVESEEEEESEEESEEELKSKKKKDNKKDKKKDQHKKKKGEESDEEDEEEEEDKIVDKAKNKEEKKGKKNKKSKSKENDSDNAEEKSDEDEPDGKSAKGKENDKEGKDDKNKSKDKPEVKKEEKKKSRLCIIL